MSDIKSKPIIRWAGSKRKLLPELVKRVPLEYERYIEPFCGSACLFFELPAKKAILSDINEELINTYKQLKKDKDIRDKLIAIPVSKDDYYKYRAIDPVSLSKLEQAIRFLYLNRYCFNGIYRTNQSGKFNVPMGSRTGGFPDGKTFESARKKLHKARLISADYKKVLKEAAQGDFVYIDPPYAKSEKFTGEYGPGSFNASDLPIFISELDGLDSRGAKFLFSYRACQKTAKDLSDRYKVDRVNVMRHIAGFKSEWNEVEEILVRNYE